MDIFTYDQQRFPTNTFRVNNKANNPSESLDLVSTFQKNIQNPVKHLRWRFLRKQLTTESQSSILDV